MKPQNHPALWLLITGLVSAAALPANAQTGGENSIREDWVTVNPPPMPEVKAVTPWTPDPHTELINPWRYWNLHTQRHGLEKQILADGPGGSRGIRVTGDYGERSSLNHNFANDAKLDPGRYRFAFRVRGTPDQSVEFELADGWRRVSKETRIPLTGQWREHRIEFEIKTTFKDETTLRFSLPRDVNGTFDLADTRLKVVKYGFRK